MRHSKTFGAIDAGIVLAGLSLLSQVFKRGQEGYQQLEKQGSQVLKRGQKGYQRLERQGLAPPPWTLPLIAIGAAAATIAAINPDRIVPRTVRWFRQTFLPSTPTRRRTKAAAAKRMRATKARVKSASARAKMNHLASGKKTRKSHAEARR
jgi:hypothetical protein